MSKSPIKNLHKKNISLDEKNFEIILSPLNSKKSWSSTNNLSEDIQVSSPIRNSLSRRIQNNNEGQLTISIDNLNNLSDDNHTVYSISQESDDNEETIKGNYKKDILNDTRLYISNIAGFFYYLILTSVITLIINGATQEDPLFNIDSMFFVYLSPIFYKLAFREIFFYSLKHDKKIIKIYYPISLIIGFSIRFLDYIPFLQKFVLNTKDFINDGPYIALFTVFLIYMFLIFFNELYKSKYRKLNFGLLIGGCLFIFLTVSFKFNNDFVLHIHHYFIGLLLHIVCQTKRSKISVINNAIGLGVFIEGISRWGFGELYYKLN